MPSKETTVCVYLSLTGFVVIYLARSLCWKNQKNAVDLYKENDRLYRILNDIVQ